MDGVEGQWVDRTVADGLFTVWLPRGAHLDDVDGVEVWATPGGRGRLTVVTGDAGGGVDELLANEREHGEVTVERDEQLGQGMRRVRYRVRRFRPREIVADEGGTRHTGGDAVEHLLDFVFADHEDGRLTRIGIAADGDLPSDELDVLNEIVDRLEINRLR